ncbi:uncharacterized protein DEA37_0004751 [Paragonimus westermani]|uniref:Vitellinogen open beta-sheet domain-containing protein n=1 Tax=Paragonimus westermani TaxID=34504 RepID=A0A5J4NB62_9TREM|nr:uncharacterized protein DEA37_0004751 [Paragonimus westermani]
MLATIFLTHCGHLVNKFVGSYIYSYLKESLAAGLSNSLLKSVGQPFEQEILEAGRAFSLSSMSYSKHYARSINIGKGLVILEASVIFCPESPIPRSFALNVSLAVFGQLINLIEVGIRTTEQRQIAKYIRHLFQRITAEMSVEAVQPDEFDSQVRRTVLVYKVFPVFIVSLQYYYWLLLCGVRIEFQGQADSDIYFVGTLPNSHPRDDLRIFQPTSHISSPVNNSVSFWAPPCVLTNGVETSKVIKHHF